MKIEGYTEISLEEHNKLRGYGGLYVDDQDSNKVRYFKKTQKFPICFENKNFDIRVNVDSIVVYEKGDDEILTFQYNNSFPLLVKAIKKAEEVAKKNE